MGLVYLAALVLALGAIVVPQLVGGHAADGVDGVAGGHDAGAAHAGAELGHGEPFVALFLSLRFWSFAALGFAIFTSIKPQRARITAPLYAAAFRNTPPRPPAPPLPVPRCSLRCARSRTA